MTFLRSLFYFCASRLWHTRHLSLHGGIDGGTLAWGSDGSSDETDQLPSVVLQVQVWDAGQVMRWRFPVKESNQWLQMLIKPQRDDGKKRGKKEKKVFAASVIGQVAHLCVVHACSLSFTSDFIVSSWFVWLHDICIHILCDCTKYGLFFFIANTVLWEMFRDLSRIISAGILMISCRRWLWQPIHFH